MVQRVLSVSFTQILRVLALLLLPLAFISLIAWATAGSTSGNTSDPIRAAIWLWLGAHHIPFTVNLAGAAGFLSYLPLGAVVLPFLALRSGFSKALYKLHMDYHSIAMVRVTYSLVYTLFVTVLAFLAQSDGVQPVWYLAPIFSFLIAYFATFTAGNGARLSTPILYASRALAVLVGLSFIYLAILIFTHHATIEKLTTVLAPGVFGGGLLFLLNIFYLPNIAISVLSYFSGAGFAVGSNSHISPFSRHIDQIPAFPLLGVIPESTSKFALIAIVVAIMVGVLIALWSIPNGATTLFQTLFITAVGTAILAYLGSGALITEAMGAVGVSIWQLTLFLNAQIFLGAIATFYLPPLLSRSRE